MPETIETLLFDFGGTLDADGVAWKDRFHALYQAEGLVIAAEAFAPAFYAADDPLVGGLAPRRVLRRRSTRLPPISNRNWPSSIPAADAEQDRRP